jgi:hypothetical protein
MSWHLANPLMLLGLLGVAIPVVVHLLNRRRAQVIDWGAMQFLDIGRRARRKIQLTDVLLLGGRMLLLGLVAVAVARPFWTPREAAGSAGGPPAGRAQRRDVVLVLDGSASMLRRAGGTSARDRAIAWCRDVPGRLAPGSSVSVLLASDRVRPLVDALSYDGARVREALKEVPPSGGSSDLPAAIVEALRRLEAGRNPARDIILLWDGQKLPWRTGEARSWALLRELHREFTRRHGVEPRIWAIAVRPSAPTAGADGAVGPLEVARGVVPPLLPLAIRTVITNGGPDPLTRTAELRIDGRAVPGSAQVVGPVPPGGRSPLTFKAVVADLGSHAVGVSLAPGDDPLPTNDEASRPIEVIPALPVLLVDGEPGREPLSSETDFLRAALAPTGDGTPQVAASVVPLADFTAAALEDRHVVVLANVERLDAAQASAISTFVGEGGGLLVAPGDRTDPDFLNEQSFRDGTGWLPAKFGLLRGEPSRREAVAHPAPSSFSGPTLLPFAQGEAPALGEASLFAYRVLEPAPRAAVLGRLDTGDPWIVEKPHRRGRVLVMAGPLDAEGGTLPANPDYVPLLHELVYHLADPSAASAEVRPGEPLAINLDPAPEATVTTLAVTTPTGATVQAAVVREAGRVRAVLDPADEPGLYRFALPAPASGYAYAAVAADPREADPTPLSANDAARLAEGWSLAFDPDVERRPDRIFSSARSGPNPIWRVLVLAALAGLCLEVVLTRRMAHARGILPAAGEP